MPRDRISILLVEDSPADAELARACLRDSRIANNVTWLRDGQDALDYILRNSLPNGTTPPQPPDLILLDLNMPRLGGIELVRRLKANDATKNIPIVVMTASKEDHDIIESYNIGTNGYIVKPLDFASFVEVTRQIGFEWLAVEPSPTSPRGVRTG
jgi:two-component system, response regulator